MTAKAKEVAGETVPSAYIDTLKVALYGQFGSRKTLQIGSLIDLVGANNVLIVSAEHGLNTIRSKVKEAQVIVISSMDELRKNFQKLNEFAAKVGREGWLAVDGMSQVTEWLANDQLAGADRYYIASKLGQTIDQNDQQYGRFLQRGEINSMAIYGKVGRDSENLLSALIGLPCNLYVNYLEDKTGSSGFEKTLPWGPDVPGRVGLRAIMSSFDFVGRLTYNAEKKLVAGFDSSRPEFYLARTRDDHAVVEVPREIVDFDLGQFAAMVQGEGV